MLAGRVGVPPIWEDDDARVGHHFIRPKWGLYRSLADAPTPRADVEEVRYQRFTISKLVAAP